MMFCTFCAIISPEWTHSCQGSGDWKVVATSGHLTLAAHPLDYVQFRVNGSHHAHEADLAIEDFCEGVFGFVAFQVQFGRTAEAARRLMRQPLDGHLF